MRLMRKRRASAPGHTVWQPTGSQIIIAAKVIKKEKLQQPLQWETEEEKTVRDLAEHMVQKEEIRRIMDIVVSYEREWIRIFQKKCFEEKTFAQIAEEMDLAESTVKTRFYQMLKRIRQEVQR